MSAENGSMIPGQKEWKAPPPAYEVQRLRELSNESKKTNEGPDTAGTPIFNVEGVRTFVPMDAKGIRDAFGDISLDQIVIPSAKVDELPAVRETERSILDHDEELPPSPRMQKVFSVLKRLRLPLVLFGAALGMSGAKAGAEAYHGIEAGQQAVESAMQVSRDSVGSGLSEFSAAHAVSAGETVALPDGTSMSREEIGKLGDLGITDQFAHQIDNYGNGSGVTDLVLSLAPSNAERALVEGVRDEAVKTHDGLVSELSPMLGQNVDSVADGILREGNVKDSHLKNLQAALSKTYGDSSAGMIESLQSSGVSVDDVYAKLIEVDRANGATHQYEKILSHSGETVQIVDAALATIAYGQVLHMGDGALRVAGYADGMSGSPAEVTAKEKAVQAMMVSRDGDTVFSITSTMGGDSVGRSFGSELPLNVSADTVEFAHALARSVAEGGHLDASAVKSVRGVINGQIRLNIAEKALVDLEGAIGDFGTHDGAVSRVPEAVQKVIDAKNSLELQEKILSAATGGDPSVQAMMDQLKQANDSSVRIILEQGKLISGVMSSGATDGSSWDAQIASL